jgi:hypothetical protein
MHVRSIFRCTHRDTCGAARKVGCAIRHPGRLACPLRHLFFSLHGIFQKPSIQKVWIHLKFGRFLNSKIEKIWYFLCGIRNKIKETWWKTPKINEKQGRNIKCDASMRDYHTINYKVHGYILHVSAPPKFKLWSSSSIKVINKHDRYKVLIRLLLIKV